MVKWASFFVLCYQGFPFRGYWKETRLMSEPLIVLEWVGDTIEDLAYSFFLILFLLSSLFWFLVGLGVDWSGWISHVWTSTAILLGTRATWSICKTWNAESMSGPDYTPSPFGFERGVECRTISTRPRGCQQQMTTTEISNPSKFRLAASASVLLGPSSRLKLYIARPDTSYIGQFPSNDQQDYLNRAILLPGSL